MVDGVCYTNYNHAIYVKQKTKFYIILIKYSAVIINSIVQTPIWVGFCSLTLGNVLVTVILVGVS